MKQSKKPARWEFLNELDGRPTDNTPIRPHGRRLALWEIALYAVAGLLWVAALTLGIIGRYGTVALTVLGVCALCLRWAVFELTRRKRCKGALLGQVESFTRRRVIRKSAKYPVIRFEVDGSVYHVHSTHPAPPSAHGNEVWVRYNLRDPSDSFASPDSNLKLAVGLTLLTAVLGVVVTILEMS